MLKSDILTQVEKIYRDGGNISQFLKSQNYDSTEAIMISYEFQAGSYVAMNDINPGEKNKFNRQVIAELERLGSFDSILEAGVGKATTFKYVINSDKINYSNYFAFDISWSRLKVAKDFLKNTSVNQHLFVAELASIPLRDNAIDIVYTAHSVEPNGGHEKEILQELYRVTNNYLLLFEPDYDLADDEGKAHMDKHGYVKNLAKTAEELGYNIIRKEPIDTDYPLNPTSVIVIEKSKAKIKLSDNFFQCPISKAALVDCGEIYFAENPHLMYPVIQGIPCLLDSQAILGCRYEPNL